MRTAVGSGAGASAAARAIPTAVPLTVADIDALARRDGVVSSDAVVSQQGTVASSRSVAELQAVVQSLQQENAELRERLERDRRQMLRSAMDVRDLHASQKQIRQRDLDRIEWLYCDNQRLRKILEMQGSAQELAGVLSPQPPAAAPATAHRPSLEGLRPLPEVPVELNAIEEEMPALEAEVVHLRGALVLKTQHLDDLWGHAERAEGYVQDLLQKLEHVQGIVREESDSCARRSKHLESTDQPLEDIVSFVSLRDHSSATQLTGPSSTTPFPFATVGRCEHIKRAAAVHGG
ncbi:hypothetical protein LMJF_32_3850 [Leishmania major strain Friedlin]|uniref:Uncharacterized protein n=1 Tax=Leishmania major TaxID=5664 RepID=Q4Q4N7_LEIMA|nr:hypothetical protein LMJF_32_3850 [Leishmania major strain Friedlin]CAG9580535.1 hypothetical_protein_-_conserved [Leishmania major strain Friedlin]CAJ08916.1 hypothetical protein LMJF_32_3850 [Leishmania major strain Friedlin]|eukprot:XP_001685711.1 hypothetical protein LMJF_32_3850 [Leishmania major strain Friedlin]